MPDGAHGVPAAAKGAGVVRATDLTRNAGVTYRQLDYWTTCGYLPVETVEWSRPDGPSGGTRSLKSAANGLADVARPGSGRARIYDDRTVTKVRIMARLVAVGMQPGAASKMADALICDGSADLGGGVRLVAS